MASDLEFHCLPMSSKRMLDVYGITHLISIVQQHVQIVYVCVLWIFYVFFCLALAMPLCASVYMCLVVTCWERANLLALVCGVSLQFPIGNLGQVWYLIVSILALSTLTYLHTYIYTYPSQIMSFSAET